MTAAHAPPYGGYVTTVPAGVARLQSVALWLIGFSGAFVRFEPAPYDFIVTLAMLLFAATGLKLRPAHAPDGKLDVLALRRIAQIAEIVDAPQGAEPGERLARGHIRRLF